MRQEGVDRPAKNGLSGEAPVLFRQIAASTNAAPARHDQGGRRHCMPINVAAAPAAYLTGLQCSAI